MSQKQGGRHPFFGQNLKHFSNHGLNSFIHFSILETLQFSSIWWDLKPVAIVGPAGSHTGNFPVQYSAHSLRGGDMGVLDLDDQNRFDRNWRWYGGISKVTVVMMWTSILRGHWLCEDADKSYVIDDLVGVNKEQDLLITVYNGFGDLLNW